jgi:hypothetical protein
MSDDAMKSLLENIWWHGEGYGTGLNTSDKSKDEVIEEAAQQIRQEQEFARHRGYEKGVADTLKIVKKTDYLKQLKKKSRYE